MLIIYLLRQLDLLYNTLLIAIYKKIMVSHCYQTNKCQRNSEEKLIMLKTDEFRKVIF